MLIQFNGTWLTNNGSQDERVISSACDFKLNGKLMTQEADFLRAITPSFFSRGNRSNSVEFSVWFTFASVALAEAFLLSYGDTLPTNGQVQFTCGVGGDTITYAQAANGVLSVTDGSYTGVSVKISYQIKCSTITSTASFSATQIDGGLEGISYAFVLNAPSIVDGGNFADKFFNSALNIDGGVG